MIVEIISGEKQMAMKKNKYICKNNTSECHYARKICYNSYMKIVLFGVKHSGKSTVGKEISKAIDKPFFDLDEVIEKQTDKSPREIYTEGGESAFIEAEKNACVYIQNLKEADFVLATGGGICNNVEALKILQSFGDAMFVYLDANEETVVERIIKNSRRQGSYPAYIAKENPADEDDVKKIFHKFYIKRTELYKTFCKHDIKCEKKSPKRIADEILEIVKS